MNLTELARRLRCRPDELREKLPELGFSVGKRAIKIDDRVANKIQQAWGEMRRKERLQQKMEEQKTHAELRDQKREEAKENPISVPPIITVRDLASLMDIPVPRLMQELMRNGILASLNERIDFDTASIVAEDLGFMAIPADSEGSGESDEDVNRLAKTIEAEKKGDLKERAPVIVVMGHVDHGKTKLLDAIRRTDVVASEAGGITQHIGAYQVVRHNRPLTFIDTPGHEAFTVMRSRGAKVADIAILVVAADDGVQPQTKEAIDIIKSAHLPFIVALNKIDRPEANIDRVKGELSEAKVIPEDWGGDIPMVPISAKEGIGIEDLLDVLLLVADMNKDRIVANPDRKAIGTIIESHVDSGEGPVATVLVQNGSLRLHDALGVRGAMYGKVRGMRDWNGGQVETAPPSTPVKIIGFKYAPTIGDVMEVPKDRQALKKLKSKPVRAVEEVAAIRHGAHAESEEENEEKMHALNLIIRADVLGSLEAILGMLDKIKHDLVSVDVVGKGLGNITEVDVLNAESTGAQILAFNVRPTAAAEDSARDKNVEIKEYSVIYKLFEDVLDELQKMLPSEKVFTELGKAEVLANFKKTDNGWIAGAKMLDGKFVPKAKLRIIRGGEIIGEGEIIKLQTGRSEAKDVKGGQEFGFQYKSRTKVEIGDIIEAYSEEMKGRILKIEGISLR